MFLSLLVRWLMIQYLVFSVHTHIPWLPYIGNLFGLILRFYWLLTKAWDFFLYFFFTDLLLPYVPFPLPKILGYIILSRSRLTHKGDRTFAVRASSLWNYLPEEIKAVNSVLSFKSLLKNNYFKSAIQKCYFLYNISFYCLRSFSVSLLACLIHFILVCSVKHSVTVSWQVPCQLNIVIILSWLLCMRICALTRAPLLSRIMKIMRVSNQLCSTIR